MYAPAHTAIALAAKRANPSASLFGLMVAAQGSELLWVTFSYLGIEHSTVDKGGTLHLEYLPYSHSLLTGLGGGIFLWALLRWVFRRNDVATIFGWVFASHIVLDFIQHEPNLQIAPGIATPTFGLNLQSIPWLDFAIELALCRMLGLLPRERPAIDRIHRAQRDQYSADALGRWRREPSGIQPNHPAHHHPVHHRSCLGRRLHL